MSLIFESYASTHPQTYFKFLNKIWNKKAAFQLPHIAGLIVGDSMYFLASAKQGNYVRDLKLPKQIGKTGNI